MIRGPAQCRIVKGHKDQGLAGRTAIGALGPAQQIRDRGELPCLLLAGADHARGEGLEVMPLAIPTHGTGVLAEVLGTEG